MSIPALAPAAAPPLRGEIAVLLACVALALAATAVVLAGPGWPYNHDGLSAFERTEWFRRAFLAGDFFPTWTPFCFNGHGSPGPFFYHRLFYTIAGAIAASTGSTPGAVAATLVLLLAIGGFGMARLGAELGWSVALRLAAAALLIGAPYTYTDWLVRGALAELSAGMLVPWLFLLGLRIMRGERVPVALGLVWALLFYAHIVIWLYASIVLAIVFGAALVRERSAVSREGWRAPSVRNLVSMLAVTALATGVYALAIRRLGARFGLEQLRVYLPATSFIAPKHYLFVPKFIWGEDWRGWSVEIGRAALIGLGALIPIALLARGRIASRAIVLAGTTALVCFALQLEAAAPFYRYVPLADAIQFPYRLLTFITPAVVVLACELAAAALRARRRGPALAATAVIGCTVAAQAAFALSAQRIRYPWYTRAEIAHALDDLDGPWSGREFLAKDVDAVPPRAPFLRLDGCALRSSAPARDLSRAFHFTRMELEVEAGDPCVLHFSQFATPFVGVEGVAPDAVQRTREGTIDVHLGPGVHRVAFTRHGVLGALLADAAARHRG